MTRAEANRRLDAHHQHMMRWGVRTLQGALRAAEPAMPDNQRMESINQKAALIAAELEEQVAARATPLPERFVEQNELWACMHAMDRAFARAVLAEAVALLPGPVNGARAEGGRG